MAQSRLNAPPRARHVALVCAALALLAGGAFGLTLLSGTERGTVNAVTTISPAGVVATRASRIRRDVAATATSAAHLPTARAASPPATVPRIVLDWRASGSQGPQLFTVSGREWKLDLVCSGVPRGMSSVSLLVRTRVLNTSLTADTLVYACPAGASGGATSANFHDSGDFWLNVDNADDAVVWEVLVTDIP
jgi:hypothetical protein